MKRQILLLLCIFLNYCISGQVVKLTSGATLKTTGGALVTLDNLHLENDGTLNQSAGEGSFLFNGNQNATISGTSLPVFDIVEIAKTGGAELSLMRSIHVISGINFTSGLFNLNNNTILLFPNGLLNGESETSRLYGANGGYIEITTALNTPSSVNPGNLGAMISSSQNPGSTTIRRGHQSQPVPGAGSIFRYYDILPANNNSLNATFRFHYFDAELNGFDENTIVMWKNPDNTNWTNESFATRNTISNYVEKSGIADFSRWTLSADIAARPITSVNSRQNTPKISAFDGNIKDIWKAWPNPANQTLFLNITASKESKAVIKISDSKGALLAIQHHYLMPGTNQLHIDVSKLAAGVYHVTGEWGNGQAKESVRLVKL
jgi:hypothetical protein